MTEQQINKQIQQDWTEFQSSKFEGNLPKDFMKKVKLAVMAVPPFAHKFQIAQLEGMIRRGEDEMTIVDVEVAVKLLLNVAPKELYHNVYDFLAEHEEIEEIALVISAMNSQQQEKLNKKKKSLMNLGGVNGGNANQRIIAGN